MEMNGLGKGGIEVDRAVLAAGVNFPKTVLVNLKGDMRLYPLGLGPLSQSYEGKEHMCMFKNVAPCGRELSHWNIDLRQGKT